MLHAARVLAPVACLSLLCGCAIKALLPGAPDYEVPPGPRTLEELTPDERLDYLRRAHLWRPQTTGALDLLQGPPGPGSFRFDETVTCSYDEKETAGLDGATPKFACRIGASDVVKVKYGRDNGEVYAEVAGTRLLWALGFGADRIYPVRVVCRGCPADPWQERAAEPGAERTFDLAVIERKAPGEPIEVKGAEPGWAWYELGALDPTQGGAPAAHADALRLLAAFMQHGDNKDEQQRFVCLPDGLVTRPDGSESCTAPFLMVSDVGATFARADLMNRNKMDYQGWASVPVWRDRERCEAQLKRSWTGTLGHPVIGEGGRAMLASLLGALSDEQIRDLFRASRVERRGETIEAGESARPVTLDDWVAVFHRKRSEIAEKRCPPGKG